MKDILILSILLTIIAPVVIIEYILTA